MRNKWVLVEGESITAIFAETEDEAQAIVTKEGLTGTLVPAEDYQDATGIMRAEKLQRLYAKIQGISVIELIKPEALTAKGVKAQKVIGRIKQLQAANAAEVEVFNPDEP